MDHEGFMRIALDLADHAAGLAEVPVGAIVVQGDRVVGRGYNLREAHQDPTAHAEIVALRQAARTLGSWRLDTCAIYVTLEPCPMCAGALVQARIGHCYFGCTDPKAGFTGTLADISQFPGLNHHYPVTGGILAEDCSHRLKDFFRTLRASRRS